MIFRRICSSLLFLVLLFFYVLPSVRAEVFLRTSADTFRDEVFVAVDFRLDEGSHMSKSADNGGFRLSWEYAEVLAEYWPESASGQYTENFSVIYRLKIKNKAEPVRYDLFYVVCGDSCMPLQEAGELVPNGLLSASEIEKVSSKSHMNILLMILFGFIGGLILNFMPCVFPIISMKIFSIFKLSKQSTSYIRKHTLAFSMGIFAIFITLGCGIKFLQGFSAGVGWGFYMQEPIFVFVLLLVFLACAVHFLDIYHFKMPNLRRCRFPVKNETLTSFFSGIFGGLASTSCVGPFAGVALAGAILYGSAFQSLMIFVALCTGVATPFLLIATFPKLIYRFPQPGNWLNIFKECMGSAMLLSCVWPISILMGQISVSGIVYILLISILIVFCFNILGHYHKSKIGRYLAGIGIVGLVLAGVYHANPQRDIARVNWIDYSVAHFNDAFARKTPMFLNFTARWCMNCQFNQRIFSDPEVVKTFKENGVVAFKCDWTNRDIGITALMKKYNAVAVPLYVYYPGDGNFRVLPTFLTKSKLLDAIRGDYARR